MRYQIKSRLSTEPKEYIVLFVHIYGLRKFILILWLIALAVPIV